MLARSTACGSAPRASTTSFYKEGVLANNSKHTLTNCGSEIVVTVVKPIMH